eukprot:3771917-Pyramimonas_sp.AAC.1
MRGEFAGMRGEFTGTRNEFAGTRGQPHSSPVLQAGPEEVKPRAPRQSRVRRFRVSVSAPRSRAHGHEHCRSDGRDLTERSPPITRESDPPVDSLRMSSVSVSIPTERG